MADEYVARWLSDQVALSQTRVVFPSQFDPPFEHNDQRAV